MWWLIALRGLRRGEAAGLRWADVDLDAGVFMVEHSASPTATS
jgi:integrase